MLLAWKNAQRFDASTFLLIDSVCAPLPSVSEIARNSASTAISRAIFLFDPDACSACSACSMLSCALMILSCLDGPRLTEPRDVRKRQAACDGSVSEREPSCPGRAAALLRCCAEPGPIAVIAAAWAPAQQRNTSRCAASGARERLTAADACWRRL